MAFFGVTYLMPIVCSVIYQDGMLIDFAIAAAINVGVGLAHRRRHQTLST